MSRIQPTFSVGKFKLIFDWMCASFEQEVSLRLLVHHIRHLLPAKVDGVRELRSIVEEQKRAFDQGFFRFFVKEN